MDEILGSWRKQYVIMQCEEKFQERYDDLFIGPAEIIGPLSLLRSK